MGKLKASDRLVVNITKTIEKSMTRAQRWSTFWRHNYKAIFDKHDLIVAVVIIVVVLAPWVFLDLLNVTKLKYGAIPALSIAVAASALKKLVSFPNLNHWLGFLEEKIEKTPVPKYGSAPHDKLRIIAFLQDLDRYEDKIIMQVLQSLNTVLKACEINFVLALDKNISRKATTSEKDVDPDHLISQIIQFPVTLYPVFKVNSEIEDNIKKQRPPLKPETQVQEMSCNERKTFEKLKCFSREISGIRQNYIRYHNFARNVITHIMDPVTKISSQWDKELVAWIFICSQWRKEMNILIQNWHAYVDVEAVKGEPSLKEIVDNYIKKEEDYKRKEKNAANSQNIKKKEADFKEEEKEENRRKSLQKALEIQDVSMNSIQFFQHFRFHCDAGYLKPRSDLSSN
ncbi:hypothetical protein SUGI_1133390 [Cryptomeria japonica]|nr:hypothetical protein SUGI_1133390 [Cryptomeria japonica]